MVRQKECVKIQKQLKSTRKAVDEVIRQNTEKSAPTGNVKGTLHFLKVASVSQRFFLIKTSKMF